MPITAVSLVGAGDATDLASYTTASITPTANTLILAAFRNAFSPGPPNTPTASGNSLTWVVVGSVVNDIDRVTLFRAMGTPTAGGVTFAHAGQVQLRGQWSIVQFLGTDTTGTNGSGAVVQSKTASGTGTVGTADFDAAFADPVNNAAYSTIGKAGAAQVDPEVGFTELHDISISSTHLETMWRVGEDQTPAPFWTTSVAWEQIIVEVKAASSLTVSGSNRMGGTGAIRKPPRFIR